MAADDVAAPPGSTAPDVTASAAARTTARAFWLPLVFFGAAEFGAMPFEAPVCDPDPLGGDMGGCFFSHQPAFGLGPFHDILNAATYGIVLTFAGVIVTLWWCHRAHAAITPWWPLATVVVGLGGGYPAAELLSDHLAVDADLTVLWLVVVALLLVTLSVQSRSRALLGLAVLDLAAAAIAMTRGAATSGGDPATLAPSALVLLIGGLVALGYAAAPPRPR